MRKNYIEKYDFFKFLKELTNLPDGCFTQPYYFKEFEYIDIFVLYMRKNNPFEIDAFYYKKPLNVRTSFSQTTLLFSCDVNINIMSERFLFNPQFATVKDFHNSYVSDFQELKELMTDCVDWDMATQRELGV